MYDINQKIPYTFTTLISACRFARYKNMFRITLPDGSIWIYRVIQTHEPTKNNQVAILSPTIIQKYKYWIRLPANLDIGNIDTCLTEEQLLVYYNDL